MASNTNQHFSLSYGLDQVYAIKWKDKNCGEYSCIMIHPDESDKIIKEHCSHEGFEIHIVEIKA